MLWGSHSLGAPADREASPTLERAMSPERIDWICREIETIRECRFTTNVLVEVQDPKAFSAYVAKGLRKEYGDDMGAAYVRALVVLGALERPVDLLEVVLRLLNDQAAAHYDPDPLRKRYYLLSADAAPALLDLVSSHELCHALQDQKFDLYGMLERDLVFLRSNADAGFARQALFEGDATLVMTIWMLTQQLGPDAVPQATSLAAISLQAQAALNLDDMVALSRKMAETDPTYGSLGLKEETLKVVPRFLVRSLMAVYMQGALMVAHVRKEGGWTGVNALYERLPTSTEQILHPEKLMGVREEPLPVGIPDATEWLPAGWRLLENNVLGELGMRLLLEEFLDAPSAMGAAAGWGGDRYCLYVAGDDASHWLVWQTLWDSEQDAREFAVAYQAALAVRFPALIRLAGGRRADGQIVQDWRLAPDRSLRLIRHETGVRILDTTNEALLTHPSADRDAL